MNLKADFDLDLISIDSIDPCIVNYSAYIIVSEVLL